MTTEHGHSAALAIPEWSIAALDCGFEAFVAASDRALATPDHVLAYSPVIVGIPASERVFFVRNDCEADRPQFHTNDGCHYLAIPHLQDPRDWRHLIKGTFRQVGVRALFSVTAFRTDNPLDDGREHLYIRQGLLLWPDGGYARKVTDIIDFDEDDEPVFLGVEDNGVEGKKKYRKFAEQTWLADFL